MAYCSPIMASNYQKDLKQAREDLADLLANREQIEIEIARQKRKVAALSELCDESELGDGVNEALQSLGLDLGGLSDACRTAMRASRKEWMTITEIQESLKELGFPLDKFKKPPRQLPRPLTGLPTIMKLSLKSASAELGIQMGGTRMFPNILLRDLRRAGLPVKRQSQPWKQWKRIKLRPKRRGNASLLVSA